MRRQSRPRLSSPIVHRPPASLPSSPPSCTHAPCPALLPSLFLDLSPAWPVPPAAPRSLKTRPSPVNKAVRSPRSPCPPARRPTRRLPALSLSLVPLRTAIVLCPTPALAPPRQLPPPSQPTRPPTTRTPPSPSATTLPRPHPRAGSSGRLFLSARTRSASARGSSARRSARAPRVRPSPPSLAHFALLASRSRSRLGSVNSCVAAVVVTGEGRNGYGAGGSARADALFSFREG